MSSMNCQNGTCTNRGVGDGPSPVRFMKCARCKKVSYCSKACQIEHWKAHRPICKELKNSVALPDMDNNLSRLDELRLAFEGRHAPPEQRLVRMSLTDSDSDSRKAAKFAASLDQQDVTQYALEKCLETGDRGAVVFNIKYPYMDTPTFSRLYWIPRQSFVSTLHPTISKGVTTYDPAKSCRIMFMLPSQDYRSAKVWSIEVCYSLPQNHPLWNGVQELKQEWDERKRLKTQGNR